MLALRSFARTLPRATLRASPIAHRATQRYIAVSKPSIISRTTPYKAFSTTRTRREPAGDNDAELVAKIESEISLEVKPTLPQELEDFLADSKFTLEDVEGKETIHLVKKFGNETIRVEANISDLLNDSEIDELEEDDAMFDEADEDATSGGKKTINQSKGGPIDVMPEDSLAPSDREAGEDMMPMSEPNPSINLNITIDKGTDGAVNIIAQVEDGEINIENVHLYRSVDVIDSKTWEMNKEAFSHYGGPPFANLDGELQQIYQTYIEERGINAQLADILPKYLDYKEQREYLNWLNGLKKFVSA